MSLNPRQKYKCAPLVGRLHAPRTSPSVRSDGGTVPHFEQALGAERNERKETQMCCANEPAVELAGGARPRRVVCSSL